MAPVFGPTPPLCPKIPDDMSFGFAASLPVVFCTAYYALVHVAHLKQGESILIHSAAGGVGQAAIQLALMLNADIHVTVGNEEKKRLLMDLYKIPEDHFFSSRSESFAEEIMRMTGGIDVVLNSLSGGKLRSSWSCIAPFGRFVEIGRRDTEDNECLPMSPFYQKVVFASVDISVVFQKSKSLIGELMDSVMTLVSHNHLRGPQPLHVYKTSELEKAFRYLQGGKNTGKTVVEFLGDDIVPVCFTIVNIARGKLIILLHNLDCTKH